MTIDPAFLAKRLKPQFKLPAGATDAHCHVFGPGAVFPYAPNRRYTPEDAPKEMLRALHDHLGISRAVIVQASCHGTDNRAMMDCLAWDPKRYRGVAIVDDTFTDADYDKMHAAGVRGVRFNFIKHLGGTPDMDVFYKVIDRIKGRGWHVVLHLGGPDIIPNMETIKKLPLTFVVDHMGRVSAKDGLDQPPFKALMELAKLDNCWIKVCGAERIDFPPYDKAVPVARRILETIPDKVMWGTDFPHPNASHEADEAELVDLVPQFAPEADLQRRVLIDNPARLYEF
ncbi:2-pyrone-4,6-dicarboxylate hydrolase [Pseudolabrys sp. Root1462]|uniref:amidohydrolase family protein n=1 Tax=Pseudolabrys sp. Root1462 TaxID=1736466 RepID=UPI000703B8A5|nr:2-pyrone-4,6-dicarboxylate hydrolase [Pseudolabrys sp. Root1462]